MAVLGSNAKGAVQALHVRETNLYNYRSPTSLSVDDYQAIQ